jgi:hypothetical protein
MFDARGKRDSSGNSPHPLASAQHFVFVRADQSRSHFIAGFYGHSSRK